MWGKRLSSIKSGLIVLGIITGTVHFGYSQIVHAGLRAGLNYSWTRPYDKDFRQHYNVVPILGFNAGFAFSFRVKERYFLHTDLIYSSKGRVMTGDLELHDKVVYHHIDLPITYNIYFKGRLKGTKQFKWYLGLGPNFSYWLGGKGRIKHFELMDFEVDHLDYKLKFGERPDDQTGVSETVYVTDPNRLQLGVNIGGGIFLEPIARRKIMVDLRLEIGHTWLGTKESTDFVFPASYEDDLRTRNMGARLSLMYMFETNTDKKIRNKGKSTINSKTGQKRKRR